MTDHSGKTIIQYGFITIEITYVETYCASLGMAHLEVRVIEPERHPLPITETGYKSHFIAHDEVMACGSPEGYLRAWLKSAETSKQWQQVLRDREQLTLF